MSAERTHVRVDGPSAQRRGRSAGFASLRRSPLRVDCPAVLGARGRAKNSPFCPLRGQRRSDNFARPRLRRGNPRAPALLGAAEARIPPTARASAWSSGVPRARRRSARRSMPPSSGSPGALRFSSSEPSSHAKPWAVGRLRASAAPRSGGLRGLRIAVRRCVERSCPSTEHRQLAQRDAARARASSALARGDRAPQGSRRAAATAAVKRSRPTAHGFARSVARAI